MLGRESDISNVSFLVEASTLQGYNNHAFFVSEKKIFKKHVSCFIFKHSSTLGGAVLEIIDFKIYVVLFLLFGLCFLHLENEGEGKEECCL